MAGCDAPVYDDGYTERVVPPGEVDALLRELTGADVLTEREQFLSDLAEAEELGRAREFLEPF